MKRLISHSNNPEVGASTNTLPPLKVCLREKTARWDWEFYIISRRGRDSDVRIVSVEFNIESKAIDSGYIEVAPSERIYYEPPTVEDYVKINPDGVLILSHYKAKDWESYELTCQEEEAIEEYIMNSYEY